MRDLAGREFKTGQWIVVNAPCMSTSDRHFRIGQVSEVVGKQVHYTYQKWNYAAPATLKQSWCKPKYAMVLGTLEGVPQYVNG